MDGTITVIGGNYLTSVKHLPQFRKKIHCLSLLQQDALLTTIQQCELYNELSNHIDMEEDYIWLEVIFSNVTLEDISQADVAICYYVSGYIAQRIDNQRKCTSCNKSLISSNTSSEVTESLFEEHQKLFKMANRGGLAEPVRFALQLRYLRCNFSMLWHRMLKI